MVCNYCNNLAAIQLQIDVQCRLTVHDDSPENLDDQKFLFAARIFFYIFRAIFLTKILSKNSDFSGIPCDSVRIAPSVANIPDRLISHSMRKEFLIYRPLYRFCRKITRGFVISS